MFLMCVRHLFPAQSVVGLQSVDIQHVSNMRPFTVQKTAYCIPKDGLLHGKRPSLGKLGVADGAAIRL